MMERLSGIVATLWFFFALLSLFVALAFSPLGLRLLLPGIHPFTWIYPAFLVVPPFVLAGRKVLNPKNFRGLLWILASGLAAMGLLLGAFITTMLVGH